MIKVQMIKTGGGFKAANDCDLDALKPIEVGKLVLAEVGQPGNPKFHRKFLALIDLGFELWEPSKELKFAGIPAVKKFEKFKSDCICQAGFYDVVVNLKGNVVVISKPLDFDEMDETKFNRVYDDVFNVIWKAVIEPKGQWTVEKMKSTLEDLISYD